jgi:hypothetical protein
VRSCRQKRCCHLPDMFGLSLQLLLLGVLQHVLQLTEKSAYRDCFTRFFFSSLSASITIRKYTFWDINGK